TSHTESLGRAIPRDPVDRARSVSLARCRRLRSPDRRLERRPRMAFRCVCGNDGDLGSGLPVVVRKAMAASHLTIFWIAVAAYLVAVVGIGLWSYGRTSKEEGFLVAGRSLGPVIGGATLMANQVSAGATIGIVGFHYYSGFSYAWSWPLTWIGWMVCALF